MIPFIWAFLTSIKQPVAAFSPTPTWIFDPTLESYQTLWQQQGIGQNLTNSVIVTVGTVVISMIIATPAAYALARYSGRIGFVLLALALLFRALPHMVYVLPFYYIARLTGLYDTRLILILAIVALNQPFSIWMLRGFFMGVPPALDEAAQVDGCTRFQGFVRVILPVMVPAIITASIFTMLYAYNEFLLAIVLTANDAVTLPVVIATFGAESLNYWTTSAAAAVLVALPLIIVVLFLQKYIIRGLTAGAVK
jgi:multiple sugar transport system permease protein